ncbi:MAG: S8 family serine peptidase [Candidatus Latescibacterota bacterium]|nr:MAG: S8 family serine peptidase [Candidatus Latescibacterota bacterium]
MKRIGLSLLAMGVFAVLTMTGRDLGSQEVIGHAPNQVIVKMRPGSAPTDKDAVLANLGASVIRHFSLIDAELWQISGLSPEDAVERFSNDPRIEYIEPDYIVYADDLFPDDPEFERLWGLHNTGQTGGTPDADIDAPEAWQIETGDTVLVGVIDTGVDWTHEDLAANMWINPGEIPGNDTDDDGNGYVDDVRGWDFVGNDELPMDDHGHGSHVSGTIAAVGNNGIGVVGVSWSARIMALKFLNSEGQGYTSGAISAVEYATMMGAKLTNNSWGGGGASEALRDAIEASGNAGMLFVASAGNAGRDTDVFPQYPAAYDLENIITVAWTNHNDGLAMNSNYGATTVDLGAPGQGIYSSLPGNTYGYYNGTSMAAPHVSGAASLLWADSPGLGNLEVKELILSSVDSIPDLVGRSVTGGRLNVFGALRALVDTIPPAAVTDLATTAPTSNSITLTWTASGDDGTQWTADSYDIRYSLSPIAGTNFDLATEVPGEPQPSPPGSYETFTVGGLDFDTMYYFALKVIDKRDNVSDVSNSPSGTTLGPPDISVDPLSLEESLLTGGTSTQSLTIRNIGEGTLDFDIADRPWMTAAPPSGTVWTGESATVDVLFDATGLAGGDHEDILVVSSNDPDEPDYPVPVVLHVTAAPDIAVSPIELDFEPTWIGETARDTLVISNLGSDVLNVSSIGLDNAEFGADTGGFVVAPGEFWELEVTFSPVSEGLKLGTLTITSDDPFEPVIDVSLRGIGGTAPVILAYPDAFSADLMTGERSTQILTIENVGGSDLIFSISEGATGVQATDIRIVSFGSRRPGDHLHQSSVPVARGNDLVRQVGTEVRSLKDLVGAAPRGKHQPFSKINVASGQNEQAASLDLGEQVSVLIIESNVDLDAIQIALLAYPQIAVVDIFDGQQLVPSLETLLEYDCVIVCINTPMGSPAAMGDVLADYVDAGGAVVVTEGAFTTHPPFDFALQGRFMDEGYSPFLPGPVVSFSELGVYDPYHPIMNCVEDIVSFTVTEPILAPGAVWVADYEDGEHFIATKGERVAAVNIFLFTGYWIDDVPEVIRNAVLWSTGVGQWNCWVSACPDFDTVPADESLFIEVTFDAGARCVLGGEYDDTLIVSSNDPNQPEVRITLHLSVTPLPDIAVSRDLIDYGSVFVDSVETDTLMITNEGADPLVVSGITVDNTDFVTDPSGFVLAPFETHELEVTFTPSSEGVIEGTLTVSSNDPDEAEVGVQLRGKGVISSDIAVTPGSLSDELFTGETSTHILTIENTGNGDLFFEVFEGEAGLSILGVQTTSSNDYADRPEIKNSANTSQNNFSSHQKARDIPRLTSLAADQSGDAGVKTSAASRPDSRWPILENISTGEQRRVLLLDSGLNDANIQSLLAAFEEIAIVDRFAGEVATPTLETLRDYHCVIVIVNVPFQDPVAIGDVLADYVDIGGAVILTEGAFMVVFGTDYAIHGRFMDEGYTPLEIGIWYMGTGVLGEFDESHPIMQGAEFAYAALLTATSVAPGAEWVASWHNGVPFVATQGAAVVGMNVFLDTSVPSWMGDIPLILRNAVLWSTGERVCWVSPSPTYGMVPPHGTAEVTIGFDASIGCAGGGTYTDILVVRSNDPDELRLTVPVELQVTARRILPLSANWNLVSWNLDTADDATPEVLSGIMDHLTIALGFDGGGLTFDPTIPPQFNTLNTMDHMHGYWLGMSEGDELVVIGDPVPHETPIPLSSGWNLVSYLPDEADSTAHAIGSILANTIVVLGYEGGGLMFDPSIPPEFNSLQLMKPGFGYWVKTTTDCELTYPSSSIHPGGMVTVAQKTEVTQSSGAANVTPTREWIGIWGDGVRVGGELLPVGTVVEAVDNDDVVCGRFTVTTEGKFGLMTVYKDDPQTETDEGPGVGEEITLYLGDYEIPAGVTWTAMGDVIDLGDVVTSTEDPVQSLPKTYALHNNYPNPFNPATTIKYELPTASDVRLVIYNIKGQVVRELVRKWQPAGRYTATWDGTNASGDAVASGVYFYRIKAGEYVNTRKMVFLK